jgi:predicted nucleic acid-binding protein
VIKKSDAVYLLDTDTMTEYLYGFASLQVGSKLRNILMFQVAISIVTYTELLQGWVAEINRCLSRPKSDICRAYDNLAQAQEDLRAFDTIRYTSQAEAIFQAFPSSVKRLGTNDCRIAATALAHGLVVVTRNTRDFAKIPGVKFEDWTV